MRLTRIKRFISRQACQQGQGEWISGPVTAAETTMLFQSRFPQMPRSARRPDIPQPFLRSVAEQAGGGWVDGSAL
jgi:hypothetical protein